MIRAARPDDAAALAALYGQLLGRAPAPDTVRAVIESTDDLATVAMFVNEVDGAVVGTIQAVAFASPLRDNAVKGIVDAVVVHADHRGHGYGAELVSHARDWLRRRDASPVFVSTRHDRDVAHRLYASLGWERWGVTFARP